MLSGRPDRVKVRVGGGAAGGVPPYPSAARSSGRGPADEGRTLATVRTSGQGQSPGGAAEAPAWCRPALRRLDRRDGDPAGEGRTLVLSGRPDRVKVLGGAAETQRLEADLSPASFEGLLDHAVYPGRGRPRLLVITISTPRAQCRPGRSSGERPRCAESWRQGKTGASPATFSTSTSMVRRGPRRRSGPGPVLGRAPSS